MKQKTRRRLQNIGVIILLIMCLGWVAYQFWGFTSSTYTDNARVEQRIVPVNSRVQGFVEEVRFDDYSKVKKGDTLAIIDNSEYALRLAQSKADLQNALTGKEASGTSVSTALNNITVDEAQIAEVEVLLANSKRDEERYAKLLEKGAVTSQEYDRIKANTDALDARLKALKRRKTSTSMGSQEQRVRLGQNDAQIEIAEAALRLAELNLSYTVITSPCDGYCSRKEIQPGQLVQPGQTIVYIVDTEDVWVIANYREKQTSHMSVRDTVSIKVDAIPGTTFIGYISDISAATGEQYSPGMYNHSVGNFVKIEQRVPVKIRFSGENPEEAMERLRAGMNVECKVTE